MAKLRALRAPGRAIGRLLRRTWEAGDAALVLPERAPDATVDAVLDALRPSTHTELDAHGRARTTDLAEPLPIADDVALVVTTSGSTGRPKGVELTHGALEASTRASLERLGAQPGERWALALPTHHIAGIAVHLRAWALGTEPVVADALTELSTIDAEHVALVPTQLERLLDAGAELARFRSILLGGAHARADLLSRAQDAGARVVVSYGMSETAGGCVYDGIPLTGVEVEVHDGRIRIRGPVVFRAYRGEVDATRAAFDPDGWFTTGDRGRFVDGRLEVLGRCDDVVISGGENVPVGAVAAALRTHPDVEDSAVTGRPDDRWGQAVVAIVVARPGARPPTLEDLRGHVRSRHPASWAPRALVVVDALPRDGLGKLATDRLRRLAEHG